MISSLRCSGLVKERGGGVSHLKVARESNEPAVDSLSLHTLAQLGGHTRIHFDGGGVFALFEDADSQVTSTRPDLEDHVGRAQVGLVDDSVGGEGSVRRVEGGARRANP